MKYKPKWKAYQIAVREERKALIKAQPFKMAGDAVGPTLGRERRAAQWAQWKIEALAKRQFPNTHFTLANTEARSTNSLPHSGGTMAVLWAHRIR